jgi:formamidopyrimidine-DNA glycosylase
MPELPEVETVRLQLEKLVVGKTIQTVVGYHKKSLIGDPKIVIGKKIIGTKRIGKMIVLKIEDNANIAVHLKMSGQLLYSGSKSNNCHSRPPGRRNLNHKNDGSPTRSGMTDELPHKHTRVIIIFTDDDVLYFNDQRIFGWVRIMNNEQLLMLDYVKNIGPEPWDIIDQDLFIKIKNRNRPIKLVILDQEIITGVGNIYANDALWEAEIDPKRKAKTLTLVEVKILRIAIVKVLQEGIKYGGSTGNDGKYVHLDGASGKYQEHFRVYDQKGKKCLRNDGGIIDKISLGGRGTYFCPVCQK